MKPELNTNSTFQPLFLNAFNKESTEEKFIFVMIVEIILEHKKTTQFSGTFHSCH